MVREFDLFERQPDGTLSYRGVVYGADTVRFRVRLLATETEHECFAICSSTHEMVEQIIPVTAASKRLFQIAYDEHLLEIRAELLRRWGYQVTSAIGNEMAKTALCGRPACDLFILGHTAPEEVRLAMVRWLRSYYAHTKILALNPPETQRLGDLKYNALFNSPDVWLPLVTVATGAQQHPTQPLR